MNHNAYDTYIAHAVWSSMLKADKVFARTIRQNTKAVFTQTVEKVCALTMLYRLCSD